MSEQSTASIDLAQLDKLEAIYEEARLGGKPLNPIAVWNWLEDARRSLTSGAPAEPVGEVILFGGDSDLKEVAWRKGKLPAVGTKLYAIPVHGATTPNSELIPMHHDPALVEAYNQGFEAASKSAGAAAKTDHAPDYDMNDRDLARRIMVFMGRATSGSNEPGADPLADKLAEKLAGWRAAGAGSEKATCEHCGRAPGERRDECENCPASVTVQDERAPVDDDATAKWAEQFGAQVAWANTPDMHHLIRFTPPELRVALAHPVQDGEKDAQRYRFLRNEMAFDKVASRPVTMQLRAPIYAPHHNVHTDWPAGRFEPSVDRAVDDAMAAAQQDAKGGA